MTSLLLVHFMCTSCSLGTDHLALFIMQIQSSLACACTDWSGCIPPLVIFGGVVSKADATNAIKSAGVDSQCDLILSVTIVRGPAQGTHSHGKV